MSEVARLQQRIGQTDHVRMLLVLHFIFTAITRRALRAAAFASTRDPLPTDVEAAARSACVPQSATPGAGTPGVAEPCNLSENQDMGTATHGRVVAIPRRSRQAPATARGIALQRWHGGLSMQRIVDTLRAHPRFPCIQGGAK